MEKKHLFFFATWFLLLGTVIGFFLAPIKKGVCIGSYNDCSKLYTGDEDDDSDCQVDYDEDDMPF